MNVGLLEIGIPTAGLQVVLLGGVGMASAGASGGGGHEHDYIGNWLWDDGGCILWDDGSVMAL